MTSGTVESTDLLKSRVYDACFRDIDAQAAQYQGYGQQYQQLSRGPFEGRCRFFTFGEDLAINFETANRALSVSALTPPGRYGACILLDESPPCALNAATVSHQDVVLCPERRILEGQTPEGLSMFCLDVSRELLPDDGSIVTVCMRTDPERSSQLRELVRAGLDASVALRLEHPAALRRFKSSLVDLLWLIAARPDVARDTRLDRKARAIRVFRRARDYIHNGLSDGISIVTLCREAGVSRRSLESVFRSVIGVSPASYIRVLQLNSVRRDLLSEACAGESIGAIAARYGVWHWSRFSRYYRLQFGELPSETRPRQSC
ncbi:MAG TPA: helix-turn-helix domain-containing protein [Steroidobacteraceae bacterium]|nr:helix-turn-helix domain-containing protein [Steroidobacteraceae bacterium]